MSRSQRKAEVERIRAEARFYGEPIDDDLNPAEVLLEELSRTTAAVRWIGAKIAEWDPELIRLTEDIAGAGGGMVRVNKNEALWLDVYQRERKHLAMVAKLCSELGIQERQIRIAEAQADLMFNIIEQALDALCLTAEQQNMVPKILPTIIKSAALPSAETSG